VRRLLTVATDFADASENVSLPRQLKSWGSSGSDITEARYEIFSIARTRSTPR